MISSPFSSPFLKSEHLRFLRSLGYAFVIGSTETWLEMIPVFTARLSVEDRAGLAYAALNSLGPEFAALTIEATVAVGAGHPQPPLLGFIDQASFWAEKAEHKELEAYCLASFEAMAPQRQAAFLDFVQGRKAI